MRTLKDILIVTLLMILVFMTCTQEGDILKLRHRVFKLEGGLVQVYGWIARQVQEIDVVKGGLAPADGGLGLPYFLSCTVTLVVTESIGSPITIGTTRSRSTGVFVSDNVLLTTRHSVEDRINDVGVKITGPDGTTYTAVEILEDVDDDIAIIIVQDRRGPWMELGPSPSLGDGVICIGSPLREYTNLIISWGRVSSEKCGNSFVYDGFCWGGCSGGPVIVDGKLAGIIEAKLKDTASLGFAVPLNRLDPDLMARIK
ncbi:trypsin-like peptidase domain-containing protein [Candidatus Pacearchaeota archaeon]|nr:trypsin-like peptidase domain-containing protein [Candidatus Pacearchaeota archaeon]